MFADRFTLPVLATVILCTMPHFPYLSIWVVLVCMLLWVYTYTAFRKSWTLPNTVIMKTVTALLFAAAMTTHEGFTIEAFVALLALMVSLKLLEISSSRDRMITVILCYFLIVSGLFFGDTIGATLYKLLCILVTTAVLIHVNKPERGLRAPLKLSCVLMAQAIPLMLIMFLVFPRIQGGIWGRTHINLARTGFADKITFGNIAELAQNKEPAFRVEFEGNIPKQNLLYWRGAVLWSFDGETWSRGLDRRGRPVAEIEASQSIAYTITLEPHNEHWLITLDLPAQVDLQRTHRLHDFTVYRWRPITSRVIYRGVSFTDAVVPWQKRYKKQALQLPDQVNPRSRALAEALKEETATDAEYIERVLSYFKEQPFTYTLKPPPLVSPGALTGAQNKNLVDAFLFESRKGFCGHFAGSFAFLMRAAGLPSRVVVGYQGGERNQYGEHLVVRQSDAHAWCEVWLEDKGWVRVDPTGVVAPGRLTANMENSLPPGETAGFLSLRKFGVLGHWFSNAGSMMDLINVRWNRWVMGYSINEQTGLFASVGLDLEHVPLWSNIVLFVLVVFVLVIILAALFIYRQPGSGRDNIALSWDNFCEKMARTGVSRYPGQGPMDYLQHISRQRPDLSDRAKEIISLYVQLRYSDNTDLEKIESLRAKVRHFSPGRHQT